MATDLKKALTKPRPWSSEDDATLKSLYPTKTQAQIAIEMGRTEPSIGNRVTKLKLKKDSNAGRFVAGMCPWNRGLKGVTLGGVATQYKPGNRTGAASHNYKPIGFVRINDGYLQRKVRDDGPTHRRWEMVHHRVWIDAGFDIPRGHNLIFIDGNPMNTALENLALISKAENMCQNSVHNLPKELARVVRLQGVLTRQINKRTGAKQ